MVIWLGENERLDDRPSIADSQTRSVSTRPERVESRETPWHPDEQGFIHEVICCTPLHEQTNPGGEAGQSLIDTRSHLVVNYGA